MGHRKMSAPRHGSLGVRPRKRAVSLVPRIRSWPRIDQVKPLGFPAYKVSMAHAVVVDNMPNSPTFGKEVFRPLTILEAPPVVVCAVRFYRKDSTGAENSVGEVWSTNLPKEVFRVLRPIKGKYKASVEELKKTARRISIIVATQPVKTGLGKKRPEIIEIPLGGQFEEQLKFLDYFGKELQIGDVFSPPEIVDGIAVSKGKGYEGPVARFGIKIIQKKKAKKTKRGPGADSPATPGAVMSSAPRAGQMGFHNRVDYNKTLLKIETEPAGFVPKSGFKHYGVPKSALAFVQGSVPGPTKRLVILRKAVRSYTRPPKEAPSFEFISVR